jgi:hypothetical protein
VFVQRVSARERRAIGFGLAVILGALTIAVVAMPFARRWRAREAMIATETERLARLRGLLAHEARLEEVVRGREASLQTGQQRLLSGRTPALAASALQSLLQGFADQSQLTVSRLDVAGAPDTTAGSLPMIPATISAIGDIYGITEILSRIQHGAQWLDIAELSVRPNPALRGELLQMTVKLRAPYLGS